MRLDNKSFLIRSAPPWLHLLLTLALWTTPGGSTAGQEAIASGLVVDSEGTPVAGASVGWVDADAVQKTRTCPDGSFRLRISSKGGGRLRVEVPGFLPREAEFRQGVGPLRVALRRNPSWRVRVLDAATRSAVPQASVVLEDEREAQLMRGRTGPDGVFVFHGLDVRPYVLIAEAPGHIRQRLGPLVPDEATSTDIFLAPAVRLAGDVMDEDGRPVEGASVLAWVKSTQGLDLESKAEGKTDARGAFSLGPLPQGQPILLLAKASDLRWASAVVQPSGHPAALALRRPGRLKACGSDSKTNGPATQFRLIVTALDETLRDLARVGVFSFEEMDSTNKGCASLVVPEGTYRARVRGSGLVPRELEDRSVGADEEVDLGVIGLDREAPLAIKVVGATGEPAAKVAVEVFSRRSGRTRLARQTTDRGGRAVFTGLPTGIYDVQLSSSGSIPVWEEKVSTPGPERILRLRPGGTILGDVAEAATGLPVTQFSISVLPLDVDPNRPDFRFLKLLEDAGQRLHHGEGRFVLQGLPEGRFALRVDSRGYLAATVPFQMDGARPAELHVELKRAGCATGLVMSRRDSLAVSGAILRASEPLFGLPDRLSPPIATTDADGRYEICELEPEETRRFTVDHPEFAPAEVSLRVGQSADVLLGEGSELAGLLTGSGGRAVPSWSARIAGAGWMRQTQTSSTGSFRFVHLPAGQARLLLVDPLAGDYSDREERIVKLEEGTTTEVDINLGGTLSGQVLQAGAPLAGIPIRSIQIPSGGGAPESMSLRRTRTDDEGRFTLPRLAPGAHVLQAFLEEQMVNRVVQVTPDGAEAQILVGALEISGISLDGDESTVLPAVRVRTEIAEPSRGMAEFAYLLPADGGLVEIQGFTEDVTLAQSDASGRFELFVDERVPGVVLSHPRFLAARVPLDRFLATQTPALPLFRGGSLTIHLARKGGGAEEGSACLGDVTLNALSGEMSSRSQSTNPMGEARFDAVRQGIYEIWGSCPGSARGRLQEKVEIRAGDEVDRTLALGAGAHVEVVLADNGRPPRERLWLRDGPSNLTTSVLMPLLSEASIDRAGGLLRVAIGGFPAGSFVLGDEEGISQEVVLQDGDSVEVRLGVEGK